MKNSDVAASAAKLELALKTFRTTSAAVDPQWTDAARRDFQETYLAPLEPKGAAVVAATGPGGGAPAATPVPVATPAVAKQPSPPAPRRLPAIESPDQEPSQAGQP